MLHQCIGAVSKHLYRTRESAIFSQSFYEMFHLFHLPSLLYFMRLFFYRNIWRHGKSNIGAFGMVNGNRFRAEGSHEMRDVFKQRDNQKPNQFNFLTMMHQFALWKCVQIPKFDIQRKTKSRFKIKRAQKSKHQHSNYVLLVRVLRHLHSNGYSFWSESHGNFSNFSRIHAVIVYIFPSHLTKTPHNLAELR